MLRDSGIDIVGSDLTSFSAERGHGPGVVNPLFGQSADTVVIALLRSPMVGLTLKT